MTVKYRHTSGAEREYGGRQRRLELSDEWELVQDNAPANLEGVVPSASGGESVGPGTGDPSVIEAANAATGEGEPTDGLDELNKEQLQAEADSRDLPRSGTVDELKERIREHDAGVNA